MELQQAREQQGIRALLGVLVPQVFQDKPPILARREIRVIRDLQEILALLVISALLVILVPRGLLAAQDKPQIRAQRGRLV
jgi:hypothetical protein